MKTQNPLKTIILMQELPNLLGLSGEQRNIVYGGYKETIFPYSLPVSHAGTPPKRDLKLPPKKLRVTKLRSRLRLQQQVVHLQTKGLGFMGIQKWGLGFRL